MKPYSFDCEFIGSPSMASNLFGILDRELAWVQREAPRKEYWTNSLTRPYTYGRGAGERTYQSQPSHHVIDLVAQQLQGELGFLYEGCFLNRYNDEHDSLGWHSDDDPGINHERPIAVITLGAARDIMIRPKPLNTDGVRVYTPEEIASEVERITLTPGSLLLMHPGMQQTHQHRIPKGSTKCGPRISLTYRSLVR